MFQKLLWRICYNHNITYDFYHVTFPHIINLYVMIMFFFFHLILPLDIFICLKKPYNILSGFTRWSAAFKVWETVAEFVWGGYKADSKQTAWQAAHSTEIYHSGFLTVISIEIHGQKCVNGSWFMDYSSCLSSPAQTSFKTYRLFI